MFRPSRGRVGVRAPRRRRRFLPLRWTSNVRPRGFEVRNASKPARVTSWARSPQARSSLASSRQPRPAALRTTERARPSARARMTRGDVNRGGPRGQREVGPDKSSNAPTARCPPRAGHQPSRVSPPTVARPLMAHRPVALTPPVPKGGTWRRVNCCGASSCRDAGRMRRSHRCWVGWVASARDNDAAMGASRCRDSSRLLSRCAQAGACYVGHRCEGAVGDDLLRADSDLELPDAGRRGGERATRNHQLGGRRSGGFVHRPRPPGMIHPA